MRAIILIVVLFSVSCGEKSQVTVTTNVTFNDQIKPITSTVCISCHNDGIRDYSIYENAYNRRQLIYQRVVIDKSMPAGKTLTNEQRALFRDWYNQGSKE